MISSPFLLYRGLDPCRTVAAGAALSYINYAQSRYRLGQVLLQGGAHSAGAGQLFHKDLLDLVGQDGLGQVNAEDGSVGIRVTSELFSKELCYRFQKAVVSTSANISGEPTPANFSEISPEIIEAVDYVVNYKQLDMGRPKSSSIIKLTANGSVTIIRE